MLNYDPAKLVTFSVNNGYAPTVDEGPRTIPLQLDFTTDGSIYVDCTRPQSEGHIGVLQSIYVDNSQNANSLVVTVKQSGQRLVFPAGIDATQPLFAPMPCQLVFSTTQAALIVNAQLLNVPLAPSQMGPITVNATAAAPTGTYTDKSLAASGVSQVLMAANALRKGYYIENPIWTASESIFINFTAAAAINGTTSIEIPPGGSWPPNGVGISTEAINVIATTVGHVVIAKELA